MIRRKIINWDAVEPVIDTSYVAQLLGYTPEWVSRLAKAGKIPAFKIADGPWRFQKEKLITWMDERSNQK